MGIIVIVDHFCIALFLVQTHCAPVTCHSESVAVFSFECVRAFFLYPPKWCTDSAIWLLHGWCHMKLLPSQRILCTPYNHAQIYSATDTKLRASTESWPWRRNFSRYHWNEACAFVKTVGPQELRCQFCVRPWCTTHMERLKENAFFSTTTLK